MLDLTTYNFSVCKKKKKNTIEVIGNDQEKVMFSYIKHGIQQKVYEEH